MPSIKGWLESYSQNLLQISLLESTRGAFAPSYNDLAAGGRAKSQTSGGPSVHPVGRLNIEEPESASKQLIYPGGYAYLIEKVKFLKKYSVPASDNFSLRLTEIALRMRQGKRTRLLYILAEHFLYRKRRANPFKNTGEEWQEGAMT
jgi:hypothetical protein